MQGAVENDADLVFPIVDVFSQSCLYVFIVVVGLSPQLSTKCHVMCRVLLLVVIVPSFVTIYQLNEDFIVLCSLLLSYIFDSNIYIDDEISC
jgi:hypothetical protein